MQQLEHLQLSLPLQPLPLLLLQLLLLPLQPLLMWWVWRAAIRR